MLDPVQTEGDDQAKRLLIRRMGYRSGECAIEQFWQCC
ncbi:Unknown protein sequence [Pseudomonas savastanoi pv. phaseolicola]|nr:Unknown protein sequence [Pseudomonas savastanoi pv. phaseolicola]KPB72888.1 Unknown protein sequence [Pseudomonas amygdali pv. mellea]